MSERILSHEQIAAPGAAPDRWLVFLHGVYGAGRNWASVARQVVRVRPEWGAILVDLRQHGDSQGFDPPHTLAAAARDLDIFARHADLHSHAVLGHSFGGKVALAYAQGASRPPAQLWVVDSMPGAAPPGGSAWEMLAVVRRVPDRFESRGDAVAALEAEGVATPVAQWLATNLEQTEGGYRWRLDLDAIEALLRDFFRTDLWAVIEEPPAGMEAHVVKASESGNLPESACSRIEAAGRRTGRVFLHRVQGGHWLNADNPAAVVELLASEL